MIHSLKKKCLKQYSWLTPSYILLLPIFFQNNHNPGRFLQTYRTNRSSSVINLSNLTIDVILKCRHTERKERRTPPTVTLTTASTPTESPNDVSSDVPNQNNEFLVDNNDIFIQNNEVLNQNSGVLRLENDVLMESFLQSRSDSSSGLTSDCDQVLTFDFFNSKWLKLIKLVSPYIQRCTQGVRERDEKNPNGKILLIKNWKGNQTGS